MRPPPLLSPPSFFILTLLALSIWFAVAVPVAAAYSEEQVVPYSSCVFNYNYSPAGDEIVQTDGFYDKNPVRLNTATWNPETGTLSAYAYAMDPTTGPPMRPNVNASAWLVLSGTFYRPFSYVAASAVNPSPSSYCRYPAEMGFADCGCATSFVAPGGGTAYSVTTASVYALADYWYNNNEYIYDDAYAGADLALTDVKLVFHRTEVAVSASSDAFVGWPVRFTATARDGWNDITGTPYSYAWKVNGAPAGEGGQSLDYTFSSPGIYNVSCTATDSLGISDTASRLVFVRGAYLTVVTTAGGTTNPPPGTYLRTQEMATVTATPYGGYSFGYWTLDGVRQEPRPPSYTSIAVPMDQNHTVTAYFTEGLTVSLTAVPASGDAPLPVTFSALVSGGSPPYTYSFSFGDQGVYSTQASAPSAQALHTYAQGGAYQASVAVTDQMGRKGFASANVTVSSPFDFSLSKAGDIAVVAGQSASTAIYVTPSPGGGTAQPVALSVAWIGCVPAKAPSPYLSPQSVPVPPSATSLLSFTTAADTPLGTYTCRVTGTAGGVTRYVDVAVNVTTKVYSLTIVGADGGSGGGGGGGVGVGVGGGVGVGTTSPAPGTYYFPAGATASVTAVPSAPYEFDHWERGLTSSSVLIPYSVSNPVTFVMDANYTLKPVFTTVTPATLTFDVRHWDGNGASWAQGPFSEYAWLRYSGAATGEVYTSPCNVSVPVSGSDTVTVQIDPLNTNGIPVSMYGGTAKAKVYDARYYIDSSLFATIPPPSITYPSGYDLLVVATHTHLLRVDLKLADYPVNVSANAAWGFAEVTSDSPGWALYRPQYDGYEGGFGEYYVDHSHYIRVKAYPYAGYYFDRMVVDGVTCYSDTAVIPNVTSGHNVTVCFSAVPPTFTLTIAATEGGTTIPAPGTYAVPRYSYQTVVANATDPKYYFSNWMLDGAPLSPSGELALYMDHDHHVAAVFEYGGSSPMAVLPSNLDSGTAFRRVIAGEYLGVNITGTIPEVSSPTPLTVTAWLDPLGAFSWSSGGASPDPLVLRGEAVTNGSGWFTLSLGALEEGCWIAKDAPIGSALASHAEIRAGGRTLIYSDVWSIDNAMAVVDFEYREAGVNATFRLTFSDGSPVRGRPGRFFSSFSGIDLGQSSANDWGGVSSLWIPWAEIDRYRGEGHLTVVTYTNLTGTPAVMAGFAQSRVRFATLAAQFLVHNATHLALEVFDWDSETHNDVPGASAHLWLSGPSWPGGSAALPGSPFGPSCRAQLATVSGAVCLRAPDQQQSLWSLADTVAIPPSRTYLDSVLFIVHPETGDLLDDQGNRSLQMRILPPATRGVLYRSPVYLLAASVGAPAGW